MDLSIANFFVFKQYAFKRFEGRRAVYAESLSIGAHALQEMRATYGRSREYGGRH
jgi:hypothetical protein